MVIMGMTHTQIQNAKPIGNDKSAAGKNEKRQNAKSSPDTRDTGGKNSRIQKTGK